MEIKEQIDHTVTDDIKTGHYFYDVIEALYEENDVELIGKLERDDLKINFIHNHCVNVLKETKKLQAERKIPFLIASDMALELFRITEFE